MKTDLFQFLSCHETPFDNQVLKGYECPPGPSDIRYDATVDLSYVRGIWHSQYAGRTWRAQVEGEAIGESVPLKRLRGCLQQLEEHPDYFLSRRRKFAWSFYEVGGEYYVSSGSHRTVVARYFLEMNGLDPVVDGVAVMQVAPEVWQRTQDLAEARFWAGDYLLNEPEGA